MTMISNEKVGNLSVLTMLLGVLLTGLGSVGAIFIVVGYLLFVLVYLVGYHLNKLKVASNLKSKALVIADYFGMFIIYTAMMFKVQEMPGAGPLFFLAILVACVYFILFLLDRERKFTLTFNMFTPLFIGLMSVVLTFSYVKELETRHTHFERQKNSQAVKILKFNGEIYKNLSEKFNGGEEQGILDKIADLKTSTELMLTAIHSVRTNLIIEVDGVPMEVADTLSSELLSSKGNYDIPTKVLLGSSEDNSEHHRYTAAYLRMQIENYKRKIAELTSESPMFLYDSTSILRLDSTRYCTNLSGESWEVIHFYHLPFQLVVAKFTELRVEVLKTESRVLEWLDSRLEINPSNEWRKKLESDDLLHEHELENAVFDNLNKKKQQNQQIMFIVIMIFAGLFYLDRVGVLARISKYYVYFTFLLTFEYVLYVLDPIVSYYNFNAYVVLLINSVIAILVVPIESYFHNSVNKNN